MSSISLLFLFSLPSSAVMIEYELSSLGGSAYQYDYTITNDSLAAGLELFSILFDETLTENLVFVSAPADWDVQIFQPEPLLPFPGIFDALALTTPIALGDTLGGFSVSFDWLGGAAGPGEQAFELFDANFNFLGDGVTTAASPPPPPGIPEPSTISLLMLSVVGLVAGRKKVKS